VTHKISAFLSALRQLLQVGEPTQRTGFSVPLRFKSDLLNHRGADIATDRKLRTTINSQCTLVEGVYRRIVLTALSTAITQRKEELLSKNFTPLERASPSIKLQIF